MFGIWKLLILVTSTNKHAGTAIMIIGHHRTPFRLLVAQGSRRKAAKAVSGTWQVTRYGMELYSSSSSSSSSSLLSSPRWIEGSQVMARRPNSDNTQKSATATTMISATVKEHRGNGWYLLESNDDQSLFSCRSSAITSATDETPQLVVKQKTNNDNQVMADVADQDSWSTTLSPPPIFNLDESIRNYTFHLHQFPEAANDNNNNSDDLLLWQAAYYAQFTTWITFTDLHCAPSTLDTCLQVLRRVHQEASQRRQEEAAGILFLGDFWHHRGTLRVDCLNAVLQEMASWTVPIVMIPGNHDQVTLGGRSHSLTPLQHAYRIAVDPNKARAAWSWRTENDNDNDSIKIPLPSSLPGPLIFDQPTQWANALFLPYIRNASWMQALLNTPACQGDVTAKATGNHHRVGAIFCHADVKGAYMNDGIQSVTGLASYYWPRDMPIFTGHFHKPHTVTSDGGRVQIQYLGSPYQVTLSEADQVKSLSVLKRTDHGEWSIVERIPVDYGRKHYRRSMTDFFQLLPPNRDCDTNNSSSNITSKTSLFLNRNDRVVVTLDQYDGDDDMIKEQLKLVEGHVKALRTAGVHVEIRQESSNKDSPQVTDSLSSSPIVEELSIRSTWRLFLEEAVRREVMSNETAHSLHAAGLELLEQDQKLDADADADGLLSLAHKSGPIEFESVSVEGYGPFKDKVTYPLWRRGLVLLRGQNEGDMIESDESSNGSGKSTLAMAALWALTGSVDPRPVGDLKVADVIHEGSSQARVTVQGRKLNVNGDDEPVSFSVTRVKTEHKSDLTFTWNGQDATCQSPKETQAVMEELLGIASPELLGRTMFHGQFGMNGLLEATEASLKEELSLLIAPIAVWQDAAKVARKKQKDAEKRAHVLEGMISMKDEEQNALQRTLAQAEPDLKTAKEQLQLQIDRDIAMIDDHTGLPNSDGEPGLEEKLADLASKIDQIETRRKQLVFEKNEQLANLATRAERKIGVKTKIAALLQASRMKANTLTLQRKAAEEEARNWDEKWGMVEHAQLDKCPTCGQSLDQSLGARLTDAAVTKRDRITAEIARTAEAANLATEQLSAIELRLERATDSENKAKAALSLKAKVLEKAIANLERELAEMRNERDRLHSLQVTQLGRAIKRTAIKEVQKAAMDAKIRAVEQAIISVDNAEQQLAICEETLKQLKAEQKEKQTSTHLMKQLTEAFGHRGVQSFVFRNSLDSLERVTQSYLSYLSDGQQRLELSLDDGDRIMKRAFVKNTANGEFHSRPLASLSGGQWRRCALAMQLGFAELVAQRGLFRSSLLVMDEPLTHLDRAGRTKVGSVLRSLVSHHHHEGPFSDPLRLQISTVLLILQDLAAEELEEAFDAIDLVVKSGGRSTVQVDGSISIPN